MKSSVYMEKFSKVTSILPKICVCSVWLLVGYIYTKKRQINLRAMSDLVSGNQCCSGGFLKGLANRGTRGTCTRCRVLEFLSVSSLILFLQHYGPLFHIYPSASDTGYFTEGSCSLNCLGGKFCSLSPCCISHPENSKCIWKVSVKGFNRPAKPLSAAF